MARGPREPENRPSDTPGEHLRSTQGRLPAESYAASHAQELVASGSQSIGLLKIWEFGFALILLSPLVTVPVRAMLNGAMMGPDACEREVIGYGPSLVDEGLFATFGWVCPRWVWLVGFLPGLVNLLPFVGLLGGGRYRRAALVAGSLGLVRVAAPILLVLFGDAMTHRPILISKTGFDVSLDETTSVGLLLWCVSLLAFLSLRGSSLTEPRPAVDEPAPVPSAASPAAGNGPGEQRRAMPSWSPGRWTRVAAASVGIAMGAVLAVVFVTSDGGDGAPGASTPTPAGNATLATQPPTPETTGPSAETVRGVSAEQFYAENCAACHGAGRGGNIGPALTRDRLTASDDFYFEAIADGGTIMPSWRAWGLTDVEISALVAFLKGTDVVRGMSAERFFGETCARCHGDARQGGVGPPLTREALTESDDFYIETIANGRGPIMPSWRDVGLTDTEIRALVTFLKTSDP